MHQRIFHIRNGVVNSIGDAKYADNLCFHEKRFVLNCTECYNVRLYNIQVQFSFAKRARKLTLRTIMLPCTMKGQGFKLTQVYF